MKVKAHITLLKYVGMKEEWEIEIPDNELEGLDDMERFATISDWVREDLYNHYEWGWEEENE